MVGIAGIIYPDPFQTMRIVEGMAEVLAHRSSDTRSVGRHKNLEMGACGIPLAYNFHKTVWLAFDGNIANKTFLVDELKKVSRSVSLDDDITRLIIEAYEAWGVDFVQKLEGCFAIALFDERTERLFILRDRIGKKPLYWYHDKNHFVFSSDIKALLATGLVPQTASLPALATYLFFGFFPQDITPIDKVNKLLPGHYIRIHLDQNKSIAQYWSYSALFQEKPDYSSDEQAEVLDFLLKRALEKRVPRDTDIGCFVSGGLGSSSIACYLNNICEKDRLSLFTVGFAGENDQDVASAAMTANALQVKHYIGNIRPDDVFDELGDIIWHLGEPLADPQIAATWRMAKLAATHTHTAFSGMGADELLAGHVRYTLPENKIGILAKLSKETRPFFKSFVLPMIGRLYRPLALRFLKHYPTNPWQAEYLKENAILSGAYLKKAAPNLADLFDPEVFLNKFYHIGRIPHDLDATLYLDIKTRLPDLYAKQYECLTSAHGLRWMPPFFDEEIISFLGSQPKTTAPQGSSLSLLQSLVRDVLPSAVIDRPKTLRQRFLRPWADRKNIRKHFEMLREGTLVGNGIISKKWVDMLLQPSDREMNSFFYLWQLLCLEIWFRLFIDNPIKKRPPGVPVIDILTHLA